MMRPGLAFAVTVFGLAGLSGAAIVSSPITAQTALDARFSDAPDAQRALDRAQRRSAQAQNRAARFEARAASASEASAKAQAEAAALAARVQQAEAAIGVAEAELALVQSERRRIDLRLAERREPIVRLTGALQTLVRRPLSFSVLAPGSLRDTVYLGAVLDSTVPLVRESTADLRAELDRSLELQNEAREALANRRGAERRLTERRTELVAMAQRERLAARRARGAADREELRALALGEQARDLDGLVERLEAVGSLRERLAALPGPVLRPSEPGSASARVSDRAGATPPTPTPSATAPPSDYRLPVDGQLAAAFGAPGEGGVRATGLSLIPRAGAQVVAPGAGRVVFAGPYRGYGRIVIIEHANGWTSLVTGLGNLVARVGQDVVAGSPVGMAEAGNPTVTLELRRGGDPVNPLDYID
ncbi:hypothetical protein A3736_02530 [Erythrobacter sp. HI0063]|jgi:septal ring factor EnvC (AmiA/AmiB activator)|uniref:murein hydrolase activator EnvC family protein n=1 Tax=Erythrobacter sp. HI0063 TaxID=1822240 RepID=UPI0007C292A9|nr:peptidoglycan DD-metalloendopeptidase family protein [Erythrobacter sp. HI0063]KZY54427.1 hypothetical protein A3736_02530 [Erythrobacter sp. HI0063]